jgi:hypothetical protein
MKDHGGQHFCDEVGIRDVAAVDDALGHESEGLLPRNSDGSAINPPKHLLRLRQ